MLRARAVTTRKEIVNSKLGTRNYCEPLKNYVESVNFISDTMSAKSSRNLYVPYHDCMVTKP